MVRIAVIGCGPRGLSAVERVISYATAHPDRPVALTVVEPGELGVGLHDRDQPEYLLLNTVAGQLTIFSDATMVPGAPVTTGPDLFRWCRERGVTVPSHAGRRGVRYDDFLPRRLLGDYLAWAAGELLGRAPGNLRIDVRREVAAAVRPAGGHAVVELAGGGTLHADLAVVTTGHGLPASGGAGSPVARAYPLPAGVAGIAAGKTVAVIGTGLTAMDVIATLTVGRGGRHEVTADGHRYLPSGDEPAIVLVNRSGWLPAARPRLTRDRAPSTVSAFTAEAIDRLRERAADGRLSYWDDVEPLLRADLEAGLDEPGRLLVNRLFGASETWKTVAEWREQVLAQTRYDLAEAERGLGASTLKDRLEVLRDHRETLRRIADGGLTEQGHRDFFGALSATVNRTVIGPPLQRIAELLALVDAGVLDVGLGPAPDLAPAGAGWELRSTALKEPVTRSVDAVVAAHLSWPSAGEDRDPVTASIRSWAAPGRLPGELPLDRDGRVRTAGGQVTPIAVFGPPAEGASYYNHYVPSPGAWSRALTDLDRALAPRFDLDLPDIDFPDIDFADFEEQTA
ncbi:hypothetical protein GCM10010168_48450 [Actinoplanes ianthinogenes]|uniref:FAD-dependent urate hydroxylase HpyO/Asp monooxygenase CreE-like FAD/NAD(P)-binding domain-containing protein n=1 Tax=Actinoplanes ianthinogenes TaxID=122358 RepID=A0ABN6C892_9ACTN|nr:FAD/NAD(P)-binding protein [Actinoplanes ianthinogenes]BCJ40856.1 hypothetical protein Aiant_15130 [Actinoplanes ianthinogenes]GGR24739.1 hypothetical protein GCM10010168_48450 [Actinoplanes ianthinogenes]